MAHICDIYIIYVYDYFQMTLRVSARWTALRWQRRTSSKRSPTRSTRSMTEACLTGSSPNCSSWGWWVVPCVTSYLISPRCPYSYYSSSSLGHVKATQRILHREWKHIAQRRSKREKQQQSINHFIWFTNSSHFLLDCILDEAMAAFSVFILCMETKCILFYYNLNDVCPQTLETLVRNESHTSRQLQHKWSEDVSLSLSLSVDHRQPGGDSGVPGGWSFAGSHQRERQKQRDWGPRRGLHSSQRRAERPEPGHGMTFT